MFAAGGTPAGERAKDPHSKVGDGFASSVSGRGSAVVIRGRAPDPRRHITLGGFFTYNPPPCSLLVAPLFQGCHRTQLTEAEAASRHNEVMRGDEDQDPARTGVVQRLPATSAARRGSPTRSAARAQRSRSRAAGTARHWWGSQGGQVPSRDHSPLPFPQGSVRGTRGPLHGAMGLPHAAGRGPPETFLFDRRIREARGILAARSHREEVMARAAPPRVDAVAESFPDGYDTIVGERG